MALIEPRNRAKDGGSTRVSGLWRGPRAGFGSKRGPSDGQNGVVRSSLYKVSFHFFSNFFFFFSGFRERTSPSLSNRATSGHRHRRRCCRRPPHSAFGEKGALIGRAKPLGSRSTLLVA